MNDAPGKNRPQRIAAIDWVRGVAMLLMMIDHVSMANHFIDNFDEIALS